VTQDLLDTRHIVQPVPEEMRLVGMEIRILSHCYKSLFKGQSWLYISCQRLIIILGRFQKVNHRSRSLFKEYPSF